MKCLLHVTMTFWYMNWNIPTSVYLNFTASKFMLLIDKYNTQRSILDFITSVDPPSLSLYVYPCNAKSHASQFGEKNLVLFISGV